MQNDRGDDLQWVWRDSDAERELLRQGYFIVRSEYRKSGDGLRHWSLMLKQAQ